jgi:hypothetical protein
MTRTTAFSFFVEITAVRLPRFVVHRVQFQEILSLCRTLNILPESFLLYLLQIPIYPVRQVRQQMLLSACRLYSKTEGNEKINKFIPKKRLNSMFIQFPGFVIYSNHFMLLLFFQHSGYSFRMNFPSSSVTKVR